MNDELVRRWNAVVTPDDTVFHLGDVSFGTLNKTEHILHALNGRKFLVPGNHDDGLLGKKRFRACFTGVLDPIFQALLAVPGQEKPVMVVLSHFPLLSWNRMNHGSWHLHGHSHGGFPFNGLVRRLDVGVDCWS